MGMAVTVWKHVAVNGAAGVANVDPWTPRLGLEETGESSRPTRASGGAHSRADIGAQRPVALVLNSLYRCMIVETP